MKFFRVIQEAFSKQKGPRSDNKTQAPVAYYWCYLKPGEWITLPRKSNRVRQIEESGKTGGNIRVRKKKMVYKEEEK